MTGEPTRRRLLALCGGGVLTGLAGCTGTGSDDTPADDAQPLDDDSPPAETDRPDDEEQPPADDDDEPSTDDDGETHDGDADDQTQEASEEGEDILLNEVLNWDPSYVAEIAFSGAESGELTLTAHEGDSHILMDMDGMQAEAYDVDGEKYEVVEGQCFIRPSPEAQEQAPSIDDPSSDAPDVRSSETTTIDGESVYVFEMPSEEEARWYISSDTGYPVRLETPTYTATYHSWGDTDSISPPDMNCREI